MIFPEFFYRLSPVDEQARLLDPLHFSQGTNLAGGTVSHAFTVPDRHVAIVTHVFGRYTPGAGQNFTILQLQHDRGSGAAVTVTLKENRTPGAANVVGLLDWQGELVVPAGSRVLATGVFNAGVAANATELAVGGMLLPLGNIQRL